MAEVKAWPKQGPITADAPHRIKRPCDFGLELATMNLETELGSVEAYNRLCEAAHQLKAKIDRGDGKPQNPLYAVNVRGG